MSMEYQTVIKYLQKQSYYIFLKQWLFDNIQTAKVLNNLSWNVSLKAIFQRPLLVKKKRFFLHMGPKYGVRKY